MKTPESSRSSRYARQPANFPPPVCTAWLPALPTQVGTISANGEREIGELIARAMEKVRLPAALLLGAATCMWGCRVHHAWLQGCMRRQQQP